MTAIRKLFFILVLLSTLLLTLNTAWAKFPGAYTGPPEIRDIALSPGGDYIATLKQAKTKYGAVMEWDIIYITGTEKADQPKEYFEDKRFYYGVEWIDDDLLVAEGREYFRLKKRYGSREFILTINPETGEHKKIFEAENGKKSFLDVTILRHNKATREIAIMIPQKSSKILRIINVDTGDARNVATGSSKTLYWALDAKMKPILRFDQGKNDDIETVYRQDSKNKWVKVEDIDTTKVEVSKVAFDAEAEKFLVITRPDNAQRTGVYSWGPAQPNDFDLVYENPKFDIQEIEISRHTRDLTYAAWWDDYYEREWFDQDAKMKAAALSAQMGGKKNWTIMDTSEDFSVWMVYVSAPQDPGSIRIWKPGKSQLHTFEKIRPDLSESDLSPRQVIRYQAMDGLSLTGYFTPAKKNNIRSGLIVIPHGGPVARDAQDWDGWAQFLSSKGFSVWQPNFRGSGGYGRAFEEKGFREWGLKMQTDIEDGVKNLESRGLISKDSARAVVGASYGGYAALTAAYKTPERYKCIISINGISDLQTFLGKFDLKDPYEKAIYDIWVKRIGEPMKDSEKISAASPIKNTSKITADILLMHGENDRIVPVSQSQRFYEVAKQNGKTVRLKTLPNVRHRGWSDRVSTNMLTDIDTFLMMCMQ